MGWCPRRGLCHPHAPAGPTARTLRPARRRSASRDLSCAGRASQGCPPRPAAQGAPASAYRTRSVDAALAQQDPDGRGVPVGAAQPVVDDRDVGPELADVGRAELADLELDDDVAQLLDGEHSGPAPARRRRRRTGPAGRPAGQRHAVPERQQRLLQPVDQRLLEVAEHVRVPDQLLRELGVRRRQRRGEVRRRLPDPLVQPGPDPGGPARPGTSRTRSSRGRTSPAPAGC